MPGAFAQWLGRAGAVVARWAAAAVLVALLVSWVHDFGRRAPPRLPHPNHCQLEWVRCELGQQVGVPFAVVSRTEPLTASHGGYDYRLRGAPPWPEGTRVSFSGVWAEVDLIDVAHARLWRSGGGKVRTALFVVGLWGLALLRFVERRLA